MKGPLAKTVMLLVGMYVFLKFMLPLFTAPLPASLIFLYLALTLAASMIFYTMSGGSLDEFMGPIGRFLSGGGQAGLAGPARILVFVLFPLLVGWQTYTRLAPSDLPPAENRTIHPAPPGEFVGFGQSLSENAGKHHDGQGALCRVLFALSRSQFRRERSGCRGLQSAAGEFQRSRNHRPVAGILSVLANQKGRRRASGGSDALEIGHASLGSGIAGRMDLENHHG